MSSDKNSIHLSLKMEKGAENQSKWICAGCLKHVTEFYEFYTNIMAIHSEKQEPNYEDLRALNEEDIDEQCQTLYDFKDILNQGIKLILHYFKQLLLHLNGFTY